ncbi:MAG: RidA family protein, partial [Defluviitaleaceae bacterium]|nr:RidA family protein [Defluviitaleaceae bacterium]
MSVKKRLEELNIQLTAPATPLANYIPVKQAGNLVYVSGQLPSKSGELLYAGKLGKDITLEQGKQAARQCAINAVAALNSQIDLDD